MNVLGLALVLLAIRGLAVVVAGMPDWFDWEMILIVAMACAGLAVMYADWRRDKDHQVTEVNHESRLATIEALIHDSRDIVDRLARLEATSTDTMTVEQRIAALEVRAERDEHMEERIATIGERVASLETKSELGERIARVEAVLEERTEE